MAQQEANMITENEAGTLPLQQRAWSGAEARGFEPRMAAKPNRISSPLPILTASPAPCRDVLLTCGGTLRHAGA